MWRPYSYTVHMVGDYTCGHDCSSLCHACTLLIDIKVEQQSFQDPMRIPKSFLFDLLEYLSSWDDGILHIKILSYPKRTAEKEVPISYSGFAAVYTLNYICFSMIIIRFDTLCLPIWIFINMQSLPNESNQIHNAHITCLLFCWYKFNRISV